MAKSLLEQTTTLLSDAKSLLNEGKAQDAYQKIKDTHTFLCGVNWFRRADRDFLSAEKHYRSELQELGALLTDYPSVDFNSGLYSLVN